MRFLDDIFFLPFSLSLKLISKNSQFLIKMIQQNENQMEKNEQPQPQPKCNKELVFALILLTYEVLVMLLYGFLFGYNLQSFTTFEAGDLIIVSVLMILVLLGFGLVNTYITNSAFSGLSMTFLIFAFTIQNYFLMRAFWYKIGIYQPSATTDFSSDQRFQQITLANVGEDLQVSRNLPVTSMVDAIACSVSLLVAFSALVGRVGIAELFFLSLIGTFLYELNNQLLWRWFITDAGYGMRAFAFGSVLGLVICFMQGNKQSTLNHRKYFSSYAMQSLGLVGLCIMVCSFPFLCVGGIYRTSNNDSAILWIAPFNMWMSLFAGILGSTCASAFNHHKILLHDLVFGGLSVKITITQGGIAFSSSADLYRNPALPLSIGFFVGAACSIFNSRILKYWNQSGVLFSLDVLGRFFFPSLLSSIIAAVLQTGKMSEIKGFYETNKQHDRLFVVQGGYELLGLALSLGLGLAGGLILGLIIRGIRNTNPEDQFEDNRIFIVTEKQALLNNEEQNDD